MLNTIMMMILNESIHYQQVVGSNNFGFGSQVRPRVNWKENLTKSNPSDFLTQINY